MLGRKGEWWIGIQVMFAVLIIIALAAGIGVVYWAGNISSQLAEQGAVVEQMQEAVNRVDSFNERFSSLETSVGAIERSVADNQNELKLLRPAIVDLSGAEQRLENLTQSYDPVQNYYFSNVSQDQVTEAVNQISNKQLWILNINFVIGAIFGSLFSGALAFYFVYRRKD